MSDPSFDARAALDRHRSRVGERRRKLETLLRQAIYRYEKAKTDAEKAALLDGLVERARELLGAT